MHFVFCLILLCTYTPDIDVEYKQIKQTMELSAFYCSFISLHCNLLMDHAMSTPHNNLALHRYFSKDSYTDILVKHIYEKIQNRITSLCSQRGAVQHLAGHVDLKKQKKHKA